jgi:hypothetical protein
MRQIFDMWEDKRNKAEDLKLIKVLREDNNVVRIWTPKAIKPYANIRFRSLEEREQYIKDQLASHEEHEKRKQEYTEERKGSPELLNTVVPGSIFHYSWGYDQTNCEFYQVIERRGYMVLLKELKQESTGADGFMCDHRTAKKDVFLNDKVLSKKIYFWNGKPHLSFPFGSCSLWDGRPMYCSWYA